MITNISKETENDFNKVGIIHRPKVFFAILNHKRIETLFVKKKPQMEEEILLSGKSLGHI